MKKIDKLFIKAFIGPFILTTAIVDFIFLIRFFMMYLDNILGKDIGIEVFGKLVLYFSLITIPQALPLATLLATLMCFGNMGEHTELTALKSAGIPLRRLVRPTLVFTIFVGITSFFYNNYINPWANLKGYSLLYDIKTAKMTLNIQPGIFYKEIPGYRIKIQDKMPDGKTMKNVIVYDHTANTGNRNVTVADSGRMYMIYSNRYLVFELYNGKNYVENMSGISNNINETQFMRNSFKKNKIIFSLESFGIKKTSENDFKYHEYMKNVSQLTHQIDSTKKQIKTTLSSQNKQYRTQKALFFGININRNDTRKKVNIKPGSWIEKKLKSSNVYTYRKGEVIESAIADIKNAKTIIEAEKISIENQKHQMWSSDVERWHKFTMAFSCVVLFFIGASLGSIIKKGGFGMPVLVSISFFILLYVLMQLGDKYAKEGFIPVWVGVWIPNFVLLLIGSYLMVIASNDARLFESDSYQKLIEKFKNSLRKVQTSLKIIKTSVST